MARNRILPYNPALRSRARALRKNSTLAEILLWQAIRGKQLNCEFHRQVPIDEYIVDFYCHELRLAIEVDGESHRGAEAYRRDVARQRRLEELGVSFLRFTDEEVKRNLAGIVGTIAERVCMAEDER